MYHFDETRVDETKAETPTINAILSFTPDNRFSAVHFEGYRGSELVVSLVLPFIGWAIIVTTVKDGEYNTRLQAVGLDDAGEPVLPVYIARNYNLREEQVIQKRLIPVEGITVDFQPWPDLLPERRDPRADI